MPIKYLTISLLLISVGLVHAEQETQKRARRPKWDPSDSAGVFFLDALREGLRGARPAHLDGKAADSHVPKNDTPDDVSPSTVNGKWEQVISGDTIESVVKGLSRDLGQSVTTPSKFAGRGYQDARRQFSVLAMLFAITAEYDGDVRWRRDAAVAQDEFSRIAANAKVGTIQAYNAAKSSKANLAELIRGGQLPKKPIKPVTDWSKVVDRPPLMQQLEASYNEQLKPWISNATRFRTERENMQVQAELIAAIAEVLVQSGMEDGDDDEYAAISRKMRAAAREASDAARLNNYDAARKAAGDISKACSVCHESYRG